MKKLCKLISLLPLVIATTALNTSCYNTKKTKTKIEDLGTSKQNKKSVMFNNKQYIFNDINELVNKITTEQKTYLPTKYIGKLNNLDFINKYNEILIDPSSIKQYRSEYITPLYKNPLNQTLPFTSGQELLDNYVNGPTKIIQYQDITGMYHNTEQEAIEASKVFNNSGIFKIPSSTLIINKKRVLFNPFSQKDFNNIITLANNNLADNQNYLIFLDNKDNAYSAGKRKFAESAIEFYKYLLNNYIDKPYKIELTFNRIKNNKENQPVSFANDLNGFVKKIDFNIKESSGETPWTKDDLSISKNVDQSWINTYMKNVPQNNKDICWDIFTYEDWNDGGQYWDGGKLWIDVGGYIIDKRDNKKFLDFDSFKVKTYSKTIDRKCMGTKVHSLNYEMIDDRYWYKSKNKYSFFTSLYLDVDRIIQQLESLQFNNYDEYKLKCNDDVKNKLSNIHAELTLENFPIYQDLIAKFINVLKEYKTKNWNTFIEYYDENHKTSKNYNKNNEIGEIDKWNIDISNINTESQFIQHLMDENLVNSTISNLNFLIFNEFSNSKRPLLAKINNEWKNVSYLSNIPISIINEGKGNTNIQFYALNFDEQSHDLNTFKNEVDDLFKGKMGNPHFEDNNFNILLDCLQTQKTRTNLQKLTDFTKIDIAKDLIIPDSNIDIFYSSFYPLQDGNSLNENISSNIMFKAISEAQDFKNKNINKYIEKQYAFANANYLIKNGYIYNTSKFILNSNELLTSANADLMLSKLLLPDESKVLYNDGANKQIIDTNIYNLYIVNDKEKHYFTSAKDATIYIKKYIEYNMKPLEQS